MKFVAILNISGLRCIIRDDTHLARKATLTRLPRKIRLSLRLASYLRARFKHFLMSYDESETNSCMHFAAVLYIFGLRLTIQKKIIS